MDDSKCNYQPKKVIITDEMIPSQFKFVRYNVLNINQKINCRYSVMKDYIKMSKVSQNPEYWLGLMPFDFAVKNERCFL